jgi:hypothetical protein
MPEEKPGDLEARIFAVGNVPYCAFYLRDTNSAFLRGIDTNYFRYLAEVHAKNLDSDDRQRAAIALRTSYYHGLETLFMLIFATLQAPNCVVGWLLKCRPAQLRILVEETTQGKMRSISSKWTVDGASWCKVSGLINGKLLEGRDDSESMQGAFAQLWERFAGDFTSDFMVDEYNSFKHGFRTQVSTGPSLSITPPKDSPGQPFTLASDFGSTFFVARKLPATEPPGLDHVFSLAYCHVNIQPTAMVSALRMISLCINNIVAFLRLVNGHPPEEIQIILPDKKEAFGLLPETPGALKYICFNPTVTIRPDALHEFTKTRIIERLTTPTRKANLD